MNSLPDPRRTDQCVYSQAHLIWLGIVLFMTHLGSRRQLRFERLAEGFETNLARLSGQRGLRLSLILTRWLTTPSVPTSASLRNFSLVWPQNSFA